jgi:hypothetical protein
MDVLDRVLEALNARDLDAFVDCYTEDATIERDFDNVVVRGHAELRARYGEMFERFPELHVEPLYRLETGTFVVRHEEVTGRGEPERHSAHYQLRDGRIAREVLL